MGDLEETDCHETKSATPDFSHYCDWGTNGIAP